MRLHHVGIATDDVVATALLFEELFETPICHREQYEGLEIRFLQLPDGYLELIEPTGDGTVARFLDRSGPGLHHLGFVVEDIDAALTTAVDLGITPIDQTARQGAWGHEVAFLHPEDTAGILIEFVSLEDG